MAQKTGNYHTWYEICTCLRQGWTCYNLEHCGCLARFAVTCSGAGNFCMDKPDKDSRGFYVICSDSFVFNLLPWGSNRETASHLLPASSPPHLALYSFHVWCIIRQNVPWLSIGGKSLLLLCAVSKVSQLIDCPVSWVSSLLCLSWLVLQCDAWCSFQLIRWSWILKTILNFKFTRNWRKGTLVAHYNQIWQLPIRADILVATG